MKIASKVGICITVLINEIRESFLANINPNPLLLYQIRAQFTHLQTKQKPHPLIYWSLSYRGSRGQWVPQSYIVRLAMAGHWARLA